MVFDKENEDSANTGNSCGRENCSTAAKSGSKTGQCGSLDCNSYCLLSCYTTCSKGCAIVGCGSNCTTGCIMDTNKSDCTGNCFIGCGDTCYNLTCAGGCSSAA